MAARGPQKRVRRRERKNISHAQAHIKASFNNTIINITDQQGNTIVVGRLVARWDSRVPANPLPTPPNWRQRKRPARPGNTV